MLSLTTATSHDERDRAADIAVLPIGSFEQHGGHLPLITDTVVAAAIAAAIADEHDLFLLPPITISCSHEHSAFPGTVSISATTLAAIVDDVIQSLQRQGILRLVIVNGHGGNYVLSNVTQEANVTAGRVVLFPGKDDWNAARDRAGCSTTQTDDMHGGELETSILMHVAPDLVTVGWDRADHDAPDRHRLLTDGIAALASSGIIGRPSQATDEKGRLIVQSLVDSFKRMLALLND